MQAKKPLRIGMVVGEVSGDTLGAALIRSFKALGIDAVYEGIGGEQMLAEGFKTFYPMERLAVMGVVEVLGRIRELFSIADGLQAHWQKNPPDVFIGIDAPDFNLRLAAKLKPLGIKTVHYVSPSVWAWRQGRVHGIRAAVDLVLCLFPFEVDFYKQHDVPAVFVGHPLAQQIAIAYDKAAAKQVFNLTAVQPVIGLLPGSRGGEVSRLAPLLFEAAVLLQKDLPDVQFLLPAINQLRYQQIETLLNDYPSLKPAVKLVQSKGHEGNIGRQVMAASDLVLLASGTATLECLLHGTPMVVVYRMHWFTHLIAKLLVKTPFAALPNILAGREVVPELIQYDAYPENIYKHVKQLWHTQAAVEQQQTLQAIHRRLQGEQAVNPAQAILDIL